MKFDLHTISICRKLCFKIHTLKKCAYLFDLNFRIILFKLFIQSSFDYCSTLFFHFFNKSDSDRLEKSFSEAINKFLNIKLYVLSKWTLNKTQKNEKLVKIIKTTLDIRSQIDVLDKYHMQPLQLRYLYHFLSFTYSAFNNCPGCG